MSDTEKDVSCFSVDGVVAEMVIEVEENQKSGFDEIANSPDKDTHSDKDAHSDKEKGNNDDGNFNSKSKEEEENEQSGKIEIEGKEDKENFIELSDVGKNAETRKEDKNLDKENNLTLKNNQNQKRKRQNEPSVNHSEKEKKEADMPRYPGRKRLANKRYTEDMITSKTKNSESVNSKDSSKGIKKRKIELETIESEEIKILSDEKLPKIKKRKIELESVENEEKKMPPEEKLPKRTGRNKEPNPSVKEDSNITVESDGSNKNKSVTVEEKDKETERKDGKQDVLRKLPFRKNKDAPDVPEIKPKVILWNGVGEGQGVKLGDIPDIKKHITQAKSIRALYRVLFYQWPSNGKDLVAEILEFNGFPFDKTSYEFTKRQSLMKIMLDITISNICEILGAKKGDKQTMITNILDFLLKPHGKVSDRAQKSNPSIDFSLQPVVLLEKIMLDERFFNQDFMDKSKREAVTNKSSPQKTKKAVERTPALPARTTRGSASKIEIVLDTKRMVEKSKENLKANKLKSSAMKDISRPGPKPTGKDRASSVKIKNTPSPKDNKPKTSLTVRGIKENTSSIIKDSKSRTAPTVKDTKDINRSSSAVKDNKAKTTLLEKNIKNNTSSAVKDVKPSSKEENSTVKNAVSKKFKKKKGRMKKVNSINNTKISEKKSLNDDDDDDNDYTIEMTVDSGPDLDEESEAKNKSNSPEFKEINKKVPEKLKKVSLSSTSLTDSSETESAEETKLVTASRKSTKTSIKYKGRPLKSFPKINDSIQKANFSALQRLHILLFGASDKAENLKGNILAFGGFPFLEGSDEWKQKHFLLSLLAQNNLREYLNLLCIEHGEDDQPTMINKLMRFLALPTDDSLENRRPIETEVVSSELINKPDVTPVKGKTVVKKKVKKKPEKKPENKPEKKPEKKGSGHRNRKILMSEEEARRLEASFAREQRALAREREKKAPPFPLGSEPTNFTSMPAVTTPPNRPARQLKQPATDPKQLNALLQTVYKRRALQAAGAVVSTPNKGEKTKLGDIENIKFLIVTSNLTDLEMLHRLIFMLEASKSRIRKNILDFDGFGFNEDSPNYVERMNFLNSLGYDASKRISFLLGLCPLQTDIPQQDLNELIMYFLMSPCKTKEVVPITEMPPYDEPHIIMKSIPLEKPMYNQNTTLFSPNPQKPNPPVSGQMLLTSTPVPQVGRQKARKSFASSSKASPVKKILLPPSQSALASVASVGNKPQKMALLNSVPAHSLSKSSIHPPVTNVTLLNTVGGVAVLNTPKSSANLLPKVPIVGPGSNVQILNQGSKIAVLDPMTKIPLNTIPNVPGQVLPNQILIPQMPNKVGAQLQQNIPQSPLLQGSKMIVKTPTGFSSSQQEFLVQQQTPDGQQKTFKLIRLPPNHPLASAVGKPLGQQTMLPPQVQHQLLFTNSSLPISPSSGFVLMKNSTALPSPIQNVQNVLSKSPVKVNMPISSASTSSVSQSVINPSNTKEITLPDEEESVDASGNSNDNELQASSVPEDNDTPTDEDLFSSIQDIILTSNFEDITLRNVIERVAAQFPDHDLTQRHNYMKECVKKIIIGT